MNFLTAEQQLWLDTVNRVMESEVTREYVRQCDIDRAYPYGLMTRLRGWAGCGCSFRKTRAATVAPSSTTR